MTIYQDDLGRYILGKTKRKRYYENLCEHCSGAYFPKKEGQKYCSGSCRSIACRQRNNYEYQPRFLPTAKKEKVEVQGEKKYISVEGVVNATAGSLAADAIIAGGKKLLSVKSTEEKLLDEIRALRMEISKMKNEEEEIVLLTGEPPLMFGANGKKTIALYPATTKKDGEILVRINQKGEAVQTYKYKNNKIFPLNYRKDRED